MRTILLIILAVIIVARAVWLFWLKPDTEQTSPENPDQEVMSPYFLPPDELIEVAGATIRVRSEGPQDAPVIILLHGFSFSLESWDAWALDLSRTHRVIRYDLLGHGLTGPDTDRRYAPLERANFLGEVMDALDIDSAIIAGNSLGGQIAWRYALSSPERVEKLILVSPGAYPINGVTDEPAPIPPALKFYFQSVPEAGVRISFEMLYGDDSKITDDRLSLARDMMRQPGNGDAAIHHLEEFTLPDPTMDLSQLSIPTLILWGEQDALIPVAQGPQMVSAMPNARLITYEGVGHIAHEEIPEITLTDARAFLSDEQGNSQ